MKRLVLVAASALVAAGCSYPGAIGGSGTYPVTVVLNDATNLVAEETCRSNDTVIGSVESVTLQPDLKAKVVCRIRDSVHLPANAIATLSETSLLGERFIALDPPAGVAPVGILPPGTTMPRATTRTDPDVEVVFGALSQVLNGGSLGSLETISRELTTALSGSNLGGTLTSLDQVVAKFNGHRDEINSSLVALDRLANQLATQRAVLAGALDSIPGGLAVLKRQRNRLVETLKKLSDLSGVAVPLIDATRANSGADLRHLAPVLFQLSKAGDELAATLGRVVTFPFSSTALSTIKGDFGGVYATFALDVNLLNRVLGGAKKYPVSEPASATSPSSPTALPTVVGPTQLQGLSGLLNGLLGGQK